MNHAYEGDRVMKKILALFYAVAHRNAHRNDALRANQFPETHAIYSPWLML
jgi:hypothetical protein